MEGRTQQVNHQGTLSFKASSPAGGPQGSAISPTLFNIHIKDMKDDIPVQADFSTDKYADDCTMDMASPSPPPLRIMHTVIKRVDYFKLLGTWFQKDLKWNKHVEETTRKASKNLYCLNCLGRSTKIFKG